MIFLIIKAKKEEVMPTSQVEKFGKYLLLEKLAAGGMAEVFLAKSIGAVGIQKFVAVKKILPQYSQNTEFIEMFKEEARITVNLNHSNIVPIFEFGTERNQFYLVMEYVEGKNLRQLLNEFKQNKFELSLPEIIFIIKEVASGLDHAHRCLDPQTGKALNITHRDMSPQNIMLSYEGDIKIIDFGIAKSEKQVDSTQVGTLKGKYGYMSPEQADGLPIDARTDIFSLGIILWELLAQERLFTGNNEGAILRKVRDAHIPPIRNLNSSVDHDLEQILNKSLSKDLSIRYTHSGALYRDLNKYLNSNYPDFSAQDLARTMKKVFAQEFSNHRLQLIEFAKINKLSTQTGTSDAAQSFKINNPIDSPIKSVPRPSEKTYVTNSSIKNTQIRPPHYGVVVTDHSYRFLVPLMTFIFLASTAWFTFQIINKKNLVNDHAQNENELKFEQQSATQASVINFMSHPAKANVVINGQIKDCITPCRLNLEYGKEYSIELIKEAYLPYRQKIITDNEVFTIKATLQAEPKMAELNIISNNASSQTIIYINGQRLSEKLPLASYNLAPNENILIEIKDPFTGKSAKKQLRLEAGQKYNLDLEMK